MLKRVCVLLVLLIGAMAPASQGEPEAPPSVEIPIHCETGHIILPVRIGGQGPYWFVLDTGNQQTTIFQRVADAAGIETQPLGQMGGAGSGSIRVARASDVSVEVGEGEARKATRMVEPLVVVLPESASLPSFGERRVDGFLGATFFQRQVTSVDYANERLVLHEAYTPPPGARTMDMKIGMGFPYFEGSVTPTILGEPVEPIEGVFLLDLGASHGVQVDYELAKRAGLLDADDPAQRVLGTGQGIDGVAFEMRSAPASAITMGGLELDDGQLEMITSPGGGPPLDNLVGSVGSASFRGSVITLDYANELLVIEPGAAAP